MSKRIQLRACPNYWVTGDIRSYTIEYRINPKELNWFRRIFNSWSTIGHAVGDNMFSLTIDNRKQFEYYKSKFKTEEDIIDFENTEQIKANLKHEELESERKLKDIILY